MVKFPSRATNDSESLTWEELQPAFGLPNSVRDEAGWRQAWNMSLHHRP
jgi:hypothetical protein